MFEFGALLEYQLQCAAWLSAKRAIAIVTVAIGTVACVDLMQAVLYVINGTVRCTGRKRIASNDAVADLADLCYSASLESAALADQILEAALEYPAVRVVDVKLAAQHITNQAPAMV